MSVLIDRVRASLKALKMQNIPFGYFLRFYFEKNVCLAWGMLRLKKKHLVFLHPSSKIKCASMISVGGTLVVDRNCYIDALSLNGVKFGERCSVGMCTTIMCTSSIDSLGKGLKIGNKTSLGTHGLWGCAGGIEVGDNCLFGNFVTLHSENHIYADPTKSIREQGVSHKGIKIGNDCWVGAKVTILDGTVVGDGCVIAAGAVVRGIVPPYSVIGGVPAKILKHRVLEKE